MKTTIRLLAFLAFATWIAIMCGCGGGGTNPIDIEPPIVPPGDSDIVKTVDTPGAAMAVGVSGGYAYVVDQATAEGGYGLQIIDIDPPDSAYIVNHVDMPPGNGVDVAVSDGYAYVASGSGVQIIDIDPPDSAYILKTVGGGRDIAVSGGYAYVVDHDLQIIDIDPPDSAHVVKTVDTPGEFAEGVVVSNGYAFVVDHDFSGLTKSRLVFV